MDDWAAKDPNVAKIIGWTEAPLPFADTFAQIWSLSYAHGTLYAGTKPANLLASTNGGRDWVKLHGLTDHPSADSWTPGGVGLTLHTILPDPDNQKSSGLESRQPACLRRRTAGQHGSAAIASQTPKPAATPSILPRHATATSGTAFTT